MNNPFSLSFGKEPACAVVREAQEREIIDEFLSENPANQVYMLTGVRGSGKTVTMTVIANFFREEKDWIVADLVPERNLIDQLAAELYSCRPLTSIFKEFRLNINLPGIDISFGGGLPITDTAVAIDRMLECITSKKKKILITIDEVISNPFMREFVSQFQVYVRKNYSIFLIMTGLFDNIYQLQNEKTLTFLYRAPRMTLKPLNIKRMARKYVETLAVDDSVALDMASLTKGYPFAFQVLGYLCYKEDCLWPDILDEFDVYLEEYVYEKIWSEMSSNDRKVLSAMASTEMTKVEDLRKSVDMSSSTFNTYRKRLIGKGVVSTSSYGHLEFALPRFDRFVLDNLN